MCGIVGFIGNRPALPVLIDGLRRLEYRGYDSAGLALIDPADHTLWIRKAVGRVSALEAELSDAPPDARVGIAHTRWATHGGVTEANAHPHTDEQRGLAIVHNGVIDNADELRNHLVRKGVRLRSETDTELLAHLIRRAYQGDPVKAVLSALQEIHGTFGIVVLFHEHPDRLIVAKFGSPLVIGLGDNESIVASDPQAIVSHTRNVVYLNDGEVACVRAAELELSRFDGQTMRAKMEVLEKGYEAATKEEYPHYLIKEIMEQPVSIERCLAGRLQTESGEAVLGGLNLTPDDVVGLRNIITVGCGTGYHASMIAAMAVEAIARIPARAELAVDLCSKVIVPTPQALYLTLSQSGETADLVAVVKELQLKGCRVAGVVNVVGSTLARLCGRGVYVHAGPEVAVASTKAYSGQIMVGLLISLMLGRAGVLSAEEGREIARALAAVPDLMRAYLKSPGPIEEAAREMVAARYVFFIGRGFSYPVALEGALKFKEECYVPCTGYHSGEMKHGPIAMIEPGTPVVCVVPGDSQRSRTIINMREALARRAHLIAIHTAGDREVEEMCHHSIAVPATAEYTSPLLTTLPLQLLAYHAALAVGADVDKPRNLAKSVTVA